MNGTPWLCRGARRRTARTVRAAPAATRASHTAASCAVEAPPRVARRDRDAPSPRAGATVGIGPPYRPARARPRSPVRAVFGDLPADGGQRGGTEEGQPGDRL